MNNLKKKTDIRVIGARLYFLPVTTRVPLKFGTETLTRVTCARVQVRVQDRNGRCADGWGETPISVQWVWPSLLPYVQRESALLELCARLTMGLADFNCEGHPIEVGHAFLEQVVADETARINGQRAPAEAVPHLAALVCASAFDLAVHDAYGQLHAVPTYATYTPQFMNADLSRYLAPASDLVSFNGKFPCDFLVPIENRPARIAAWHLVGGLDPLEAGDLTGDEPHDGHPVLLEDWLRRDGLDCVKIKLRGTDEAWDILRVLRVGSIANAHNLRAMALDFNCTVEEPAYVCRVLDAIAAQRPDLYDKILLVEQPFAYDLERNRLDVHEISKRKPLFLDESAHDWRLVRLGYSLGWTGVALKTCKTQTGALLSQAWAKAHGMGLMVQDLTNPMMAMMSHALLGAHADTVRGLESNQSQYYPEASAPEAVVHPGLYRRKDGAIDLSTLRGNGFGYRLDEIARSLPKPQVDAFKVS